MNMVVFTRVGVFNSIIDLLAPINKYKKKKKKKKEGRRGQEDQGNVFHAKVRSLLLSSIIITKQVETLH